VLNQNFPQEHQAKRTKLCTAILGLSSEYPVPSSIYSAYYVCSSVTCVGAGIIGRSIDGFIMVLCAMRLQAREQVNAKDKATIVCIEDTARGGCDEASHRSQSGAAFLKGTLGSQCRYPLFPAFSIFSKSSSPPRNLASLHRGSPISTAP
jgi:hypothetical protein